MVREEGAKGSKRLRREEKASRRGVMALILSHLQKGAVGFTPWAEPQGFAGVLPPRTGGKMLPPIAPSRKDGAGGPGRTEQDQPAHNGKPRCNREIKGGVG